MPLIAWVLLAFVLVLLVVPIGAILWPDTYNDYDDDNDNDY